METKVDGHDLWEVQKKFNDKFFATKGGWPGEDKLVSANKDFAIHLIAEAAEVLKEISFKMHRTAKETVDRDNVLEELIDVQKFLFGWMQIWGFTWDDVAREFLRKSSVVDQRFDQEQSLPKLKDQPCVLVDIDGVISDYPRCYYEWLWTIRDVSKERYAAMDLVEKEACKRDYRQSGAKRNLPILPGARELLERIHRGGANIILITMRPYAEYYRIYPDTLEWLKKNELHYDAIVWAKDKGLEALQNFKHILLAVDDDDKNIVLYHRAGIRTVKVEPPDGTKALLNSGLLDELLGSPRTV